MSNVDLSHRSSEFSAQNNQFKVNSVGKKNNKNQNNNLNHNNNKYSELAIGSDSAQMSPGSIQLRSTELHSPQSCHNNNNITIASTNTNSLSPSSVSPRTMSPPAEHRAQINGYISDGYQQNFTNSMTQYQTSVQPKKSFCIDALLSKNHHSNGDQSPETNRFLSDDDGAQKYSDDQREYASSPEDGISRWALI